jgi:hypothetical protein
MISKQPPHRGGGFRVRAAIYPQSMNEMSRELAEQHCRTEASARKLAQTWAREYNGEIVG